MIKTKKGPRFSWKKTSVLEGYAGFCLYRGDKFVGVARRTTGKDARKTPYHFWATGGRNSLLAGERVESMADARKGLLNFIRSENLAGRPV